MTATNQKKNEGKGVFAFPNTSKKDHMGLGKLKNWLELAIGGPEACTRKV